MDDRQQREHAAALRAVIVWRRWRAGSVRFVVLQAAMALLADELAEEETAPDPSSADG